MTALPEDGSAFLRSQTTACPGNSAYQAYAMLDLTKFLQVMLIAFVTFEEDPTNCLPSAGDSVTVTHWEAGRLPSLVLEKNHQQLQEQKGGARGTFKGKNVLPCIFPPRSNVQSSACCFT